jgi:CoA-transferase family III
MVPEFASGCRRAAPARCLGSARRAAPGSARTRRGLPGLVRARPHHPQLDVDLSAQCVQRRPQLMRRVGDKCALRLRTDGALALPGSGRELLRRCNDLSRPPGGAPARRCGAGGDQWCVITVRDDTHWRRLVAALGNPDWAHSPRMDTTGGRRSLAAEIDVALFTWTRERTPFEVTHILQVASVPAGFMRRVTDFDALFAAGALEEVVAPEDATTARAASTVSA